MAWMFFTPYTAAIWVWMMEARELERDLIRWDGESPAQQRGDE